MTKSKQVLYIKFKNNYVNDTDECFEKVIDRSFETIFFGPGYTNLDSRLSLVDQLKKILETNPIDCVFIDQYVLQYFLYGSVLFDQVGRSNFCFNVSLFEEKQNDFAQFVLELNRPKFLVALRLDTYAFQDTKFLDSFDGYLVMPPYQTALKVDETKDIEVEKFPAKATDVYKDFCLKNKNKIIQVSHIIDNNVKRHVRTKKHVTVSGCQYHWRKVMSEALKDHPHFFEMSFLHRLSLASQRYKKPRIITDFFSSIYKREFIKTIEESYLTLTDGSRLRQPIRKFFEIPYYRTLLICDPFYDHENFGFKRDVNFVEAEQDIYKQVTEIIKNYQDYANIIDQGEKLIEEKFSIDAYARIIPDVVNNILAGKKMKSAGWSCGQYQVDFIES